MSRDAGDYELCRMDDNDDGEDSKQARHSTSLLRNNNVTKQGSKRKPASSWSNDETNKHCERQKSMSWPNNYTRSISFLSNQSEEDKKQDLENIIALDSEKCNQLVNAAKYGDTELCTSMLVSTSIIDVAVLNRALCMAALSAHMDIVKLLVERGADINARNQNTFTSLHLVSASGQLDIVKYLVSQEADVNACDQWQRIPLHYAVRYAHWEIAAELIRGGADLLKMDENRRHPAVWGFQCEFVKAIISDRILDNSQKTELPEELVQSIAEKYDVRKRAQIALDSAIELNNVGLAKAIIHSEYWKYALRFETYVTRHGNEIRDTPMRKLVRTMPDVAQLVLDKCIDFSVKHPTSEDFWVMFNHEYVNDNYTDFSNMGREKRIYHSNYETLKNNDVLMIMVNHNRKKLISHPLTLAVIQRRWRRIALVYCLTVFMYATLVALLSAYMLNVPPANSVENPKINVSNSSQDLNISDGCPEEYNTRSTFKQYIGICILTSSIIGIVAETLQLIAFKRNYFRLNNVLDCYIYVTSILLVINVGLCHDSHMEEWQWHLGVFTTFLAWINCLLFIRRLPQIGIFVVMIEKIFKTFMRFFIVLMLFIMAFSVCFTVLLNNQHPFSTYWNSLIKTWVMMIGEFDFNDIFHPENQEQSGVVLYESSTYAIFIAFLVLMAIIVMNLLTGLAVDDVEGLMTNSEVKQISMQLDLALDLELVLYFLLHYWFDFTVFAEHMFPNDRQRGIARILRIPLELVIGRHLCTQTICDMAIDNKVALDFKREEEEKERRNREEINQIKAEIYFIKEKFTNIEQQLSQINDIRNMLLTLTKQQNENK